MTRHQAARRRAMATSAIGVAILAIVFMFLPALGGMITAEQPISTYPR